MRCVTKVLLCWRGGCWSHNPWITPMVLDSDVCSQERKQTGQLIVNGRTCSWDQSGTSLAKLLKKFLLRKTMGLPLKILLLVPKPTGKLLPSFPHNFHLCLCTCVANIRRYFKRLQSSGNPSWGLKQENWHPWTIFTLALCQLHINTQYLQLMKLHMK